MVKARQAWERGVGAVRLLPKCTCVKAHPVARLGCFGVLAD